MYLECEQSSKTVNMFATLWVYPASSTTSYATAPIAP